MKKFIKSLPIIGPLCIGIGKLRWKYHCWKVDPHRNLCRILRREKDLFVVQIGSNDGATGDPIFRLLQGNPKWEGLLIEPVPFLFERLKRNYRGNKNIHFDNVAITEKAGRADFFYIDPLAKERIPELPEWFDQLGSFNRSHITAFWG